VPDHGIDDLIRNPCDDTNKNFKKFTSRSFMKKTKGNGKDNHDDRDNGMNNFFP